MRIFVLFSLALSILTCGLLAAQENPIPAEPVPVPPVVSVPVVALPVVSLDVSPLGPPNLDSPYASPRDAARHRFQATLADLQTSRNMRAALQGFAESLVIDRTYVAAAFNLGVVAAVAGKWEDALAALQEAARLDPGGLGKTAAPQIERLRLICSLEATPEGQRRRRYDEALYPVLTKLPQLQPADAMAALAEVGQIDSKRWEAPALIAALHGNGHAYDVAARFLEIAVANAPDAALKSRLESARQAAERELRYAAARATADAAADRGEYGKAGELYEAAWTVIPARASNGMEAASAWLLQDDTARAATLLARLEESGNEEFASSAGAMLKQLEPIEPTAKATATGAREFFRDAGPTLPVHISDLVPAVDTNEMEMLERPLPKLVQDAEPVVLLAALSANPADAAQSASLPILPAPRVAGENPWRELAQVLSAPAPTEPVQQQPELQVPLPAVRGNLIVETSVPAVLKVNGTAIANPTPVELSLLPGLYRIGADFGSTSRERVITIKPAARLRLVFLN